MLTLDSLTWTLAFQVLFTILFTYIITTVLYNIFFHPLKSYPGPFFASVTVLWYWRTVRYCIAANSQLPLHKRYGSFVRITADTLSISDPAALETIYGPKSGFGKGTFYDGFNAHMGGRSDSFCERDEAKHAERRRIQAPYYTPGTISSFEPCVDRVVGHFVDRMDDFAQTQEIFDLATWLHRYTFDVIGEIFYGRNGGFGMVRDGIDYNGWCKAMETMGDIGAAMTYMPVVLKPFWLVSELIFGGKEARLGLGNLEKVKSDARAATEERVKEREMAKAKGEAGEVGEERNDLLTRFLDLVDEQGEEINWTRTDVATELWAIIWAGSDTTATALTAAMYFLHKHPSTLDKLRAELETAVGSGSLSLPIRYNDANKLPYLNAVIQESMRLHPSLGLGLPRIVPAPGVEICGHFVPGGMTVVMNQNAVHFDKGVFGEDAESFNPDRWLGEKEVVANMARHDMGFGFGSRVCIGRHITKIEMHKLMPTLLLKYDFEFDRPDREWKIYAGWFQRQDGVFMKVKQR